MMYFYTSHFLFYSMYLTMKSKTEKQKCLEFLFLFMCEILPTYGNFKISSVQAKLIQYGWLQI